MEALAQLDYIQTHTYGSEDFFEEINYECNKKHTEFKKAHYVGEFGLTTPTNSTNQDPTGNVLC